MAAVLVVFFFVALPLLVGVAAIVVWVVDTARISLANRKWRVVTTQSTYVPSRVWIDGRYGDPNADPTRFQDLPEYVPPPTDVDGGRRHGRRRG